MGRPDHLSKKDQGITLEPREGIRMRVYLEDLLTDRFIRENTIFTSAEEFAYFCPDVSEDGGRNTDHFIAEHSRFDSLDQMCRAAADIYVKRHFPDD